MTDFGAEIERLKKRVAAVERASRLGAAAIDDTALEVRDDTGSLRALVGQQGDGTTAVNVVNGPIPAAPTAPLVASVLGGVAAEWDGQLVGGAGVPLDFARVEVHASATPSFTPTTATLIGTIETAQGAIVTIPTTTPIYVRLVTRTTSGTASAPSTQNGPIAPALIVADDVADGIITGSKLAADAIDGKVITGATLQTAATGQRIVLTPSGVPGTNAVRMYSGVPAEVEPGELLAVVNTESANARPETKLWSPALIPNGSAALRLIGGGGPGPAPGNFYLTTGIGSGYQTISSAVAPYGSTTGTWQAYIEAPGMPLSFARFWIANDLLRWTDARGAGFTFSSDTTDPLGAAVPIGLSTDSDLTIGGTFRIGGVDQGRGRKAFVAIQANTATTTTTELAAITTPNITFQNGRAYRVHYHGLLVSSVADDIVRCRVWRGQIGSPGVSLVDSIHAHQVPVAGQQVLMDMSQVVINTTGSDITAPLIGTVIRTGGTGNVQVIANASNPAWLEVRDIGPATDYALARAV
ncbi:hypothetical protein [Streptomyces hydrogenans]|uniref:hypothetical protein n=1 Tax=Streptomyces hydrogenans TaxID=1873719 RepID=UPI0036EF79EB